MVRVGAILGGLGLGWVRLGVGRVDGWDARGVCCGTCRGSAG